MSPQRPEAKRRQRLQFALIVPPCVVGAVVGVSFAMADPAKSSHHHHNVVLAIVIAAVVAGLAAGLALVLLRRLNRRPAMQRLINTDMAQRHRATRAPTSPNRSLPAGAGPAIQPGMTVRF
jgi:phosphate/sulfate permease